jgi:transposase
LCEQFGVSRKTAYKHLQRYSAEGLKGLRERSHRPHAFPQRTDASVEALILTERRLHRTWGPKKIYDVLQVKHGFESPPASDPMGSDPMKRSDGVRLWGLGLTAG